MGKVKRHFRRAGSSIVEFRRLQVFRLQKIVLSILY